MVKIVFKYFFEMDCIGRFVMGIIFNVFRFEGYKIVLGFFLLVEEK